jgi:hypothetical protein
VVKTLHTIEGIITDHNTRHGLVTTNQTMHTAAFLALNWRPGWLAAEFSGQAVPTATGYQPGSAGPSRATSEASSGTRRRERLKLIGSHMLDTTFHILISGDINEAEQFYLQICCGIIFHCEKTTLTQNTIFIYKYS